MTPTPRPPGDREIRERIVREVDRSCLVEASAGTGKTKLLVDRILHLLRTTDTRIESVVAITFTEKAAGELKARLTDALRAARDECLERGDATGAERLAAATDSLDRAAVMTIHAFCARLLRERPVEARVCPGFGTLDESGSRTLVDEAWEDWLGDELERGDSLLRPAVEAGVKPAALRGMAGVMIENRDLLEDFDSAIPDDPLPDPEAALQAFRSALRELAERAEALLAGCGKPDTDEAYAKLRPHLPLIRSRAARLAGDDPRTALRAMEDPRLPRIGRAGRASDWTPGSLAELRNLVKAVTEGREALAEARGSVITLQTLRALRGFLDHYEMEKARRGGLDFQDLLIKARNLLRDDPAVRADFQAEFTHLFVDEFQDTDPLQAEIVASLSGGALDARAREEDRPAGGRLFIVGDPKQSIYRFRRADIQMYSRVRDRLEAAGADRHVITGNFRTVPAIAGWVNRVFGRLMPPDQAGDFRPAYSPLDARREEPADERRCPQVCRLELIAPTGGNGKLSAGERRLVEARAVAGLIRRRIEEQAWAVSRRAPGGDNWRPATWGDVAVLFRTSTALPSIEDAFRGAGIPYRVEGGKFYFQRQEVQALLAVLRAVDSPRDREALVAALRSPLFGFDDDTLLVAAAEGRLDYGLGTPPADPGLAEAFRRLREWHLRRHTDSPAAIVEEILVGTRAVEFFLLKPLGEQRAANLMKVIDEARRAGGEAGGFRAFIRQLSEREAALEAESESPTLEEGDGDFVHLLTIHKAKGLEFPIVFLVDLTGRPGNQVEALIDRREGKVAFKLGGFSGCSGATPGWDRLKQVNDQQEQAEMVRLFYVATTRARDLLILPVSAGDGRQGFRGLLEAEDLPPPIEPGVLTPEEMEEPVFRHQGRVPGPGDEGAEPARQFEEARSRFRAERDALLRSLPPAPRVLSPSGLALHAEAGAEDEAGGMEDREAAEPPESAAGATEADSGPGAAPGEIGRAVGSLVHAVLQRVDPAGETADAWIDALWNEYLPRVAGEAGPPPAVARTVPPGAPGAGGPAAIPAGPPLRERVGRLVRTAIEHPLWKRAHAAPAIFREAPFFARLPGDAYLSGIVDLAFEEAGGLVLVDYKTDAVGPEGVDPLFERYRGQGLGYAIGVAAGAARPVREVIFLFLGTGETRGLVVDDAVLAEAAALLGG